MGMQSCACADIIAIMPKHGVGGLVNSNFSDCVQNNSFDNPYSISCKML